MFLFLFYLINWNIFILKIFDNIPEIYQKYSSNLSIQKKQTFLFVEKYSIILTSLKKKNPRKQCHTLIPLDGLQFRSLPRNAPFIGARHLVRSIHGEKNECRDEKNKKKKEEGEKKLGLGSRWAGV